MGNNLGLIITASKLITSQMTDKEKEELKYEDIRRANNRKIISGLFRRNAITPTVLKNTSLDVFKKTVQSLFKNADALSTKYIYINCHGNKNGLGMVMNGNDITSVSYSDLKTILDDIPGNKVLMIESCHSGESITVATRSLHKQSIQTTPEDVNKAIINTFAPKTNLHLKTGEFRANNYLVITACHGNEFAWGSNTVNYFTRMWAEAAGWDWSKEENTTRKADREGKGYVTLKELCDYTAQHTYIEEDPDTHVVTTHYQNDMCYPENSTAPVFGDLPIYNTVPGSDIDSYYHNHLDVYGYPIELVRYYGTIQYQNFSRGVIIKYPDNPVVGHTRLRFILNSIKQAEPIDDLVDVLGFKNRYDLELYIKVKMEQDGKWIVKDQRWPDTSARLHGGKDLRIIYEGNSVSNKHPKDRSVFYDSDVLHGDSTINLTIEVWDRDRVKKDDLIRTYYFNLDISNGWGYDLPISNQFGTMFTAHSKARYHDVYTEDTKILLDFEIENFG